MSDWDETRYASFDGTSIAYRTRGSGPRDLVIVSNWFSNVEVTWEQPLLRPFFDQLATLGRLIVFDQPGTGASDAISLDTPPSLEQWSDSVRIVLDAAGSNQAVVIVQDVAFPTGALFAATHPNRTSAFVVMGAFARFAEDVDYPEGLPAESGPVLVQTGAQMWGTGEMQHALNPDMPWNEEIRSSLAVMERLTLSPRMATQMLSMLTETDVRDILPSVHVPTLVLHRENDEVFPARLGRYVASRIPGATYVEIPGRNHYLALGDWQESFGQIRDFITGAPGEPLLDDRVLATVLFTDIVESTRRAAELGDREWGALLDAHDAVVRSQLSRFRGREIKTVGDGFLATFDGPQRAIRCALSIRDALLALGLSVRAGLHTGECEMRGEDVAGLAVHIGARVSALALPGEVLVSSTLRDLVIGSGIVFHDRGTHALKGVPGEWQVFNVHG